MATISYLEILLSAIIFCFLFFRYTKKWRSNDCKSTLISDWPIIGMLPSLLNNTHRIHEYVTDVLKEKGGTFTFIGPWFANMDMLVTSNPANVHHVLSKNFSNYPKGPEFKTMFDLLGDGIFNTDSESWEFHRKITMMLVCRNEFQKFVAKTTLWKVEKGLVPVLESLVESGKEVDLQDLFQRLTFDCTCMFVLGHNPDSLSLKLPICALERAITDAEEAVLYRHILPEWFWKLQRWLQIGKEYKYMKAQEALDQFVASIILSTKQMGENKVDEDCDLLTGYLESCDDEKFLRDSIVNLIFAGTHTISAALTWFFWLLANNPSAEAKIIEEISKKLRLKNEGKKLVLDISNIEEVNKQMVYLHGALCESLRLFPTVPINHKAALESDILPSGDIIKGNTRVMLSFYAMGRMETIWGEDCLEFKPERWITEQGGIKYEPSSKFAAFNAGPRACLGKNMSLLQMKIATISTLSNFSIQVVEGYHVLPCNSVVLQIKNGLKVKVSKRDV